MAKKGKKNQIQLVIQALSGAEASIALAKQLLSSFSGIGPPPAKPQISPRQIPGIIGKFDGEALVTESGERFLVPENYASKSVIVYGDTLKMIKDPEGEQRFKQIERVKRYRVEGILAKKDGKWNVVTSDGSYKVLPAAVSYFKGEEGNAALALIPLENRHAPFAAIESIPAKEEKKEEKVAKVVKAVKKEEKGKAVAKKVKKEEKPAVRKAPLDEKKKTAPAKKKEEGAEEEEELR